MIELSVIIPVRNRKRYLMKCLDSLLNQSLDKDKYEIIIVDYGGTDDLKDDLPDDSRIRYFYSNTADEPWSMTRSTNIGIKKARGRILYMCNADILLDKNCLKYILDNFKDNMILQLGIKNVWGKYPMGKDSCFMIAALKDNFIKVGGYNEKFEGWGYDDKDILYRLRRLGLRHVYTENIINKHMHHSDGIRQRKDLRERNFKIAQEMYIKGEYIANKGKKWGVLR